MTGYFVAGLLLISPILCATPATAAQLKATPVRDVTAIQDGAGAARILFRADASVTGLSEAVISRASLTLTTTGVPSARSLQLRLYPVTATGWNALGASWTSGWARPGGDFDEEVYASAELNLTRGGSTAVFDITGILKEVLQAGMTADGFLLTLDPVEGAGIAVADLVRFGTLATATIDVQYRHVPAARVAAGARGG